VFGARASEAIMVVMRYRRAVEKLRILAEACDSVKNFGRYPEHHLWEAVQGYLDLYDAAESAG
jgi:hypothetical protein